jgi:hypothetical protein
VIAESADYESAANFGRFLLRFLGAAVGLAFLIGILAAAAVAILLR